MDAIQYQIVRANGIDFNVATAGSGERLALCLHGFPESSFSWRYQMPLLARLGYLVWAPDLRGYGRSSRPQGVEAYALEELLEDVASLIEASGAKQVVLIGHDWGALIAWYYAMFGLPPISKLIIMNVPHPALAERGLRTWRQLLKSWYIFFFQLPWLPEFMLGRRRGRATSGIIRGSSCNPARFPDEALEVYRANAARSGGLTAMINWYRAMFRGGGLRRFGAGKIPIIQIPTLFLWGNADSALSFSTTEGTEKYVANLTFRVFPGVSHWIQQEAPEAVNEMIEAWLTGKPVPEYSELAAVSH
jgi:epoxide hydrolase 4